jgi:hypothetical protein
MRFLFGMILGAAATIGIAYIHDTMYAPLSFTLPAISSEPRPMVNWDVVNTVTRRASVAAREQWDKISGK